MSRYERRHSEAFWQLPNDKSSATLSRRELGRQKLRAAQKGSEGRHLFVGSTTELWIRNHRQRYRADRKRIYEAEKRGDHHEWRWHL